jgi:hypothetical protein
MFCLRIPALSNCFHRSSTAVSLKACEVLILGQMPSYEERLIQMEGVLKNSVSSNYYEEQGLGPRRVILRRYLCLLLTIISRTPSADVLKELSFTIHRL